MKKYLPILLFLIGCAPTKIVSNAPSAYTIETERSFEEAWEKVIDYSSKLGISIRTIEKESGIIITDEYSFINSYTYEDKDGQLKNPKAWVVLNRVKGGFGNTVNPSLVTGNFNIRVKKTTAGSSITVNLVNLKASIGVKNMYGTELRRVYYTAKSTNVFEKELADKLK